MNQKIEFKSSKSIDVLKKETLDYFQKQGFKLAGSDENILQFERGSVMKNMVTFNPLKWKSSIIIKFEEDKVKADFDINTIHQAVTLKEEELWGKFISNYQKTIETGKSLISENQSELKATKKSSWKYIGYAFLGAIVFGMPSGIIAYLTGIESIVTIGAVIGALTFMMNKINKEKEENAT
jgi:hypothetical protein